MRPATTLALALLASLRSAGGNVRCRSVLAERSLVELGKHLRELFRFRIAALVCILLGVLAAVWASRVKRSRAMGSAAASWRMTFKAIGRSSCSSNAA